ncbi:MAG: hypothetical protein FJ109_18935 [Deltaproteobacteria bacterium]|nr:hypothetical protein [Deltaproteobacteria bacterium]
MEAIVVGTMTYVVQSSVAARILRMAAEADKGGDLEKALALKTTAARVETGRITAAEGLKIAMPCESALAMAS